MKITSIQRDISLKQGSIPSQKDPLSFNEKNSTGTREKINQGYKAANSGNFTRESKIAAVSFKGLTPSKFGKFLEKLEDHNIIGSALVALIFAGFMRPATIMSLPGKKDKDNKVYASGHSVASGIIGFIASLVITAPLDQGLKLVKKHPLKFGYNKLNEHNDYKRELKKLSNSVEDLAKKIDLEKQIKKISKEMPVLERIVKNIPDWIIAIPRSMITIALIPPILKYVFGLEKKPKKPVVVENKMDTSNNMMNKKTIQDFTGGSK